MPDSRRLIGQVLKLNVLLTEAPNRWLAGLLLFVSGWLILSGLLKFATYPSTAKIVMSHSVLPEPVHGLAIVWHASLSMLFGTLLLTQKSRLWHSTVLTATAILWGTSMLYSLIVVLRVGFEPSCACLGGEIFVPLSASLPLEVVFLGIVLIGLRLNERIVDDK